MKHVILGLSVFGHDASAALVQPETGDVLYAIAEERLSNIKHDSHIPVLGINNCLEYAKSSGYQITDVAVNFEPTLFLDGIFFNELVELTEDESFSQRLVALCKECLQLGDYYFYSTHPHKIINRYLKSAHHIDSKRLKQICRLIAWYFNWAVKYIKITQCIKTIIPNALIHNIPHHLSHAACAFYNSGFEESAVLVVDGQGESESISIYEGREGALLNKSKTYCPSSLGLFYLAATRHLGYGLGDEFRVMGMAAYGTPIFADLFLPHFEVNDDGILEIKESAYFGRNASTMTGHVSFDFHKKLSSVIPRRRKKDEFKQIHFDFAASIQYVTEVIGVRLAQKAMQICGSKNIVLAGGVALNGLMNEKIRTESGCEKIFIYPAAGDDGGSVGAAQYVAYRRGANKKIESMKSSYFGGQATDEEIEKCLIENKVNYVKCSDIHKDIAIELAKGNIVARYHGRSEWGPRALGNRSIIASAAKKEMKDILNARIKHREPFRPFAPACMVEHVNDYFELTGDAPFMLFIVKAKSIANEDIPAVVHNDGTARVQTVNANDNPDFYGILSRYKEITGVPVLINTSFNVNGEAIVETPLDTLESFAFMDIDFLAIGNYFISKKENAHNFKKYSDDSEYLKVRLARADNSTNSVFRGVDVSESNIFYYSGALPLIWQIFVKLPSVRKLWSYFR